ncbi:MAG: NAD(P)H-dependent oxidoreductase subunit E [Candidatus Polarisedimenticolia bacterium]
MDLRLPEAEATRAERQAVDHVLRDAHTPPEAGTHAAEGGHEARALRHLLLPALRAAQSRVGWISPGALGYICERLNVPPAEAYGVATFYHLLSMKPAPAAVAHVCDDLACQLRGAEDLCAAMDKARLPEGAAWKRSPCLGMCGRAPAVLVVRAGETPIEVSLAPASAVDVKASLRSSPRTLQEAEDSAPSMPLPQRGRPGLKLLRRTGVVDPRNLDDYRAHGGYAALRRALELGPAGVIREVTDARLVGKGGAAFPTGRKWEAVAAQTARPHYVVCNADESEPGTFKDRVLMEQDPFAVVESMTIAALATGSECGYIYIRGEYPLAARRLQTAIDAARERGLLGTSILGSPLSFDIEVRRGAGAYICGEETALFNSIEGFRGEPRNKPPFPVQSGLFRKPTAINNVETLVSVLDIVTEGGPAIAAVGTAGSAGTKLFCVSGRVERPGLFEVPFGTTLRELLALAGGVAGGAKLRAVLLGGAAGSFVGPDALDVPLTLEGTRAIGASLGSGVVMVFDETSDLWDAVRRIARFFRDESCGQCVPCRVGTVRQDEALERMGRNDGNGAADAERTLLAEVGQAMRDASICGLGQTAASAVLSALTIPDLLEGRAR